MRASARTGLPAARRRRGRGARQHAREGALPRGRRRRRAGRTSSERSRASRRSASLRVFASTLRLGRGTVTSEHGIIPVPGARDRAAAARRAGRAARDRRRAGDADRCGAARDAWSRSWVAPPPFRLERWAPGRGPRPEAAAQRAPRSLVGARRMRAPLARRRVAVLETALDDENPQFVGGPHPAAPRCRRARRDAGPDHHEEGAAGAVAGRGRAIPITPTIWPASS